MLKSCFGILETWLRNPKEAGSGLKCWWPGGTSLKNPEHSWGEAKHLQSLGSLWVLGHRLRGCAAPKACPQPWAGPGSAAFWSDTGNNEAEKYNEYTFLVGLFSNWICSPHVMGTWILGENEIWCQGWPVLARATLLLLVKHSHPP